jgi:hypothetical protein
MQSFLKNQRIKIIQGGVLLDHATVEGVSEKTISTKWDCVPNEVIKFGYIDEDESWHIIFEGLGGESCFNKKFPCTLCVI